MAAAEPTVYDASVEGLYVRGLKKLMTPTLKAKLKNIGIDLDQRIKSSYPRSVWVEAMKLSVAELFPNMTPVDGYRRLGELAIEGISDTIIGKALISMARMLGPRKSVYRLTQAFGSLNNFMRAEITDLAPNRCRIDINDCYGMPSYIEGGLGAVLRICHVDKFELKLTLGEQNAVSFDLTWL